MQIIYRRLSTQRVARTLILLCLLLSSAASAVEIKRHKQNGPDLISASTHIAATSTLLLAALEQPCHVIHWMPDLIDVRPLPDDAKLGQRIYMRTRGHLFTSPRDAINRFVRHGQSPIMIDMTSEPDALPPQTSVIRIPFARARWSLLTAEDTTIVTYQQEVAAGGNVPQWLADQYSQRHVARALESLTSYVATLSTADCSDPMRPVRPGEP